MPTVSRRSFLSAMTAFGALGVLSACSQPGQATAGRSKQSVWITYPVGTGTYNDVAAVANMLTSETGSPVRLMTSDTGIGRLAPLMNGTAQYARAGDEYYYAFEGDNEYTSEIWGPQRIRLLWTPPGNYGLLVRRDSGIEKPEDLRGKRFPNLVSSTSMNNKMLGMLKFAGLDHSDVQLVEIGYAEQAEAIKTGQLDVMYQNIQGSTVEELNTEYPIRWLDYSTSDESRYDSWEELMPMVLPGEATDGAGMSEGESVTNLQYSLPILTIAEQPADEVETLLTQMHTHFDAFKDATPDTDKFALDQLMMLPLTVPFHEGAIRFFEEHGRWTPGLQERNDALLAREDAMHNAWPDFWAEHGDAEDVRQRWQDWKRENLPALPVVDDVEGSR